MQHLFDDDVDGVTYCSRCGIWVGAALPECSGRLVKAEEDRRVHELRRTAELLNPPKGDRP